MADQHVVGRNRSIEKLEDAMLGGFNRSDVARQAKQHACATLARLAVQPPVA
jgi:hypothetical protein